MAGPKNVVGFPRKASFSSASKKEKVFLAGHHGSYSFYVDHVSICASCASVVAEYVCNSKSCETNKILNTHEICQYPLRNWGVLKC